MKRESNFYLIISIVQSIILFGVIAIWIFADSYINPSEYYWFIGSFILFGLVVLWWTIGRWAELRRQEDVFRYFLNLGYERTKIYDVGSEKEMSKCDNHEKIGLSEPPKN